MKKVFFLLSASAIMVAFVSCNKENDHNFAIPNLETRAAALGFSDVNAYKAHVAEQCEAGIHKNCDVLDNGTHQPCAYHEHVGSKHDGTHHNGKDHETCNKNGHSHKNKNNGSHH